VRDAQRRDCGRVDRGIVHPQRRRQRDLRRADPERAQAHRRSVEPAQDPLRQPS
jgi:hypothetical protein